jgi:hypothetical protein
MTVLEARVTPDQWSHLQALYADAAARLPPQMIQTFLVQSVAEPELWRITSIWRSRAGLAGC